MLDIYFAEARFYDAKNRQWMNSDPMKDGLNWYQYVRANPATFIDSSGLERIVISGGYYQESTGYEYEFIDSALREIISQTGKEKSTLLIADVGVTKEDREIIEKYANFYDFEVIYFTDVTSINEYINSGSDNNRSEDPITSLKVLSHGYVGSVEFGHGFGLSAEDKEKLSWTIEKIKNLDPTAFKNAYFVFFSCRTGNENGDGTSFAQEWSNITGGTTKALIGPSWYGDVNSFVWYRADSWLVHSNLRKLAGGYLVPYPSFSPPVAGTDATWKTFKPKK